MRCTSCPVILGEIGDPETDDMTQIRHDIKDIKAGMQRIESTITGMPIGPISYHILTYVWQTPSGKRSFGHSNP